MVDEALKTNAEGRERINRLRGNLTTVGQGVFRYAFEAFEPPDPFGTTWLMRFYDHKTFFCITASERRLSQLSIMGLVKLPYTDSSPLNTSTNS